MEKVAIENKKLWLLLSPFNYRRSYCSFFCTVPVCCQLPVGLDFILKKTRKSKNFGSRIQTLMCGNCVANDRKNLNSNVANFLKVETLHNFLQYEAEPAVLVIVQLADDMNLN